MMLKNKLAAAFAANGAIASESDYGIPSIELPFASFMKPLELIPGSQFLTARLGVNTVDFGHTDVI